MKRKPRLMKKLSADKRNGVREVIGLIGIRPGSGVTYTGLMLAFYMAEELGRKTAFLECNTHQDFRLLQWAYDWTAEENKSFSFYQLTCYRDKRPEELSELFGDNYECIIIDFGCDCTEYASSLRLCTRKIILSGSSEWDLMKLKQFVEKSYAVRGNESWCYLIPQAKESTIVKLRKELKRNVMAVPQEQEPTRLKRSSRLFLQELLNQE